MFAPFLLIVLLFSSVYEEEDFAPMTYGFNLASSEVTELRAVGMLREVEEELNRQVRSVPSTLGSFLPLSLNKSVCP